MRYSVITFDRKIFRTLKGEYSNVTISDYVSIIFIDHNRFEVADEFIMPTEGESNFTESVLT